MCGWAKVLPWKIWSLLLQQWAHNSSLGSPKGAQGSGQSPVVSYGSVFIPLYFHVCVCPWGPFVSRLAGRPSVSSYICRQWHRAVILPSSISFQCWNWENCNRVVSSREQESRARDWTLTCIHGHAHFYGPNSTVKHFMGLSIKDTV